MIKGAFPLRAAAPPKPTAAPRAEDDRAAIAHRLADHGAVFYRSILDGAFERVYRPDGSYRLREIGSGLFLDEVDRPAARRSRRD